jgi:class 3 adenylate cyclase
MTKVVWGFDDARFIEIGGEFIRSCIEPEAFRAFFAAAASYDVSSLLPEVRAKTLVLHNERNSISPVRAGQKLAAGIPEARFQTIDDMSYQKVAPLILDFLGASSGSKAAETAASPSGLVTILFTDMESSTALTQRLGDDAAQELVRQHNNVVREALKAHDGTEIKHTGDGIMASFPSARGALGCAMAIQRGLDDGDGQVRVRIGLNAGEPVAEDDDLFGTSVQLAARVCAEAEAGEILVSNVVRELSAGKGFLFNDRGDAVLRGFEDPVRLYEVRWRK